MADRNYDIIRIKEIITSGEFSIGGENRRRWQFNIIPLVLGGCFAFLFQIFISTDYLDILIGALAIFTGFYFTLMVYVTDKSSAKRKELLAEENKNMLLDQFIRDYSNFVKSLINQISYSIVLAIIIIISLFGTQLNYPIFLPESLPVDYPWIFSYLFPAIVHTFVYFLIIKLLLFILLITSNMQAFFNEEISDSTKELM